MFERVVEVGTGFYFACACAFVCFLSRCVLQKALMLNASDTHISFLPFAHIFEQLLLVSSSVYTILPVGSSSLSPRFRNRANYLRVYFFSGSRYWTLILILKLEAQTFEGHKYEFRKMSCKCRIFMNSIPQSLVRLEFCKRDSSLSLSLFFFSPCWAACGILGPWPGITPVAPCTGSVKL